MLAREPATLTQDSSAETAIIRPRTSAVAGKVPLGVGAASNASKLEGARAGGCSSRKGRRNLYFP